MSSPKYIGGVEGGATSSNLVICDLQANILGRATGPFTNHWQIGIDECVTRIIAMVHLAKEDAGLPLETPLAALGLTLSGCEQKTSNDAIAARLKEMDPTCAEEVFVASDTEGSLATAAPNGGLVLIAGTGSNALLKNPNGETRGCGGWGHVLGDEGGAFWIAHRAVKTVFDDKDDLESSEHSTDLIWQAMQEHFSIDARQDLLPYCYKDFNKSKYASLTIKLAELAEKGDKACLEVFYAAGKKIGAHVAALAKHSSSELRPLRVVCVGSVFNSWSLLEPGITRVLKERQVNVELQFLRLRITSAIGAACLAARHAGLTVQRDEGTHCHIFHTFKPEPTVESNGA